MFLQATQQGKNIRDGLKDHPSIREIRGRGLMMAIELKEPDKLKTAIRECRNEGLLVDWFLFNERSIRLAPPLIISEEEAKKVIEKISVALDRL